MTIKKPRAANKMLPSQDELWKLFSYDEETGILIRKSNGKKQTHQNASGHLPINIGGSAYYAHRIIFKMIIGRDPMPGMIVEHRDCSASNNRWSNLRECTQGQNMCNRSFRKLNHVGVLPSRNGGGKWIATICKDRRRHHLGTFDTFEEAVQGRRAGEQKYFGEYARSPKEEL